MPEPGTEPTAVAGEWQSLAERTGASPFAWPGWISAWADAFGGGELELFQRRRNGELTGVLPLVRRGGSLRTPANYHSPLFEPVAADAATVQDLISEAAAGSAVLDLDFLDPDGDAAAAMVHGPGADGRRVQVESRSGAPVIRMLGSAEEYFATLSKNLRSSIRRSRRRAQEAGDLEFTMHRAAGSDSEAWAEFLRLEGSGWKSEEGTAISSQPSLLDFYARVLEWATQHDLLRLAMTSVAGRPIAGSLTLERDGRVTVLKTGFDPEWSKMSPGKLNQDDLVSWCHANGIEVLDLGTGEFQHKLRWNVETEDRIVARSFGRGARGFVSWAANAYGRPLARRVLRRGASSEPRLPVKPASGGEGAP